MAKLEDLQPDVRVDGMTVGGSVTIVAAIFQGADTVEVVYKTPDGGIAQRLLSRSDEERLKIASEAKPWPLDADGDLFKLASEARRIELAHLFDPFVAVEAADIEPLPHQIEAVYKEMLPRQPLRYLLADDPGSGKTIMSGLYIRELAIRGDAERVLVVAPGSLVEQWQDELWQRFQLPIAIQRGAMQSPWAEAVGRWGNPFRGLAPRRVDFRNGPWTWRLLLKKWNRSRTWPRCLENQARAALLQTGLAVHPKVELIDSRSTAWHLSGEPN